MSVDVFHTRCCDVLWRLLTWGRRLPTFLFTALSLVEIQQPTLHSLKDSFPTVQLGEAEERFTLLWGLTLHLSWHVSSYHQTSWCSQSLGVGLTYINCHSMPRHTLSPIQVITIKTVLTGVRALQSAQCYFCLTLRASMFPLHLFRESCIFLHSLVHGLRCLFPE